MLIVDGHNLIGSMPMIGLDDPQCKDKLLELLEKYQYIIDERMIVVFDGSDFLRGEKYQRNKIEIFYPPKDHDADFVIKKLIEKYKNNMGVKIVTSDNELKSLARRRGLIAWQSQQFSNEIQSAVLRSGQNTEESSTTVNANDWVKYFSSKKKYPPITFDKILTQHKLK